MLKGVPPDDTLAAVLASFERELWHHLSCITALVRLLDPVWYIRPLGMDPTPWGGRKPLLWHCRTLLTQRTPMSLRQPCGPSAVRRLCPSLAMTRPARYGMSAAVWRPL